jgi:hypothetical protein
MRSFFRSAPIRISRLYLLRRWFESAPFSSNPRDSKVAGPNPPPVVETAREPVSDCGKRKLNAASNSVLTYSLDAVIQAVAPRVREPGAVELTAAVM